MLVVIADGATVALTATLESSCQQNIHILVKLSVSMFGPVWLNLTNLYNFRDKSGIFF